MALFALDHNGDRIRASQVENRNLNFSCEDCGNPLSFVDAQLKVKHFRHQVASDCGDEPETEEHEYYKDLVAIKLEELKLGQVCPEYLLGCKRADIYLKRENKRDIAFEVQATNYSFAKYEQKINCYSARRLLTVYIFIGDDFLNEVKKNIFSLKEIEKKIFHNKSYRDSVIGCYLDGENVTLPSFKQKHAKGSSGYCSDRFIFDYKNLKKMTLDDYLINVQEHKVKDEHPYICGHPEYIVKKSDKKIERYGWFCSCCGKFDKWLSNKQALSMGLKFNTING
ncbi:MAG: competence protein CoiA family protein [Nitrospirota bacterium]|nr:competence protein CoiA family protein [Nitrospirota bacterium]